MQTRSKLQGLKNRISTRLLAAFLIISLLPLAVLTMITLQQSIESLQQQVRTNLEAIAQNKSDRIESYVRERIRNTAAMARAKPLIEGLKSFSQTFDAQKIDQPSYLQADNQHRPMLKYFQQNMDYTDLFLISPSGDVVFSMGRNEDFASNLVTGPYKDSELAKSFRAALETQDTAISDYNYYQASNEPAAFIASPVRENNNLIGFVAVQLRNKEFYTTVNEYTGLGESGETVIASLQGKNAMFITPTRHEKFAAFKTRVAMDDPKFLPIQWAVSGKSGYGTAIDYRGQEVVASWRFLPTLRWGVVVKLDAREANSLVAKQRITVFVLGAVTLVLVVLAALLIARTISMPIEELTRVVKSMAEGNLSARVMVKSTDELGVLESSFNKMGQFIQDMNLNLEKMVAERTATIKTILDNVQFGFLIVGPDLKVQPGFSKSCYGLLGETLKADEDLLQALGLDQHRNADLYREFVQQAFDDLLPIEMTLRQLPSRVRIRSKTLALSARAVYGEGQKVTGLLFTIVDATDLERAELETYRHKQLVRLLKEIDSFRDFIEESRTRLELCRRFAISKENSKLRNELHTLKGNSAAFDFTEIAKKIHEIEDKSVIDVADIDEIRHAFKNFLIENYDVLQITFDDQTDELYSISRTQLQNWSTQIPKMEPEVLASRMINWINEIQYRSARTLLGALPDYGEQLASRLGKSVKIHIEGGDVGMDPEIMKPIMQALVHLVRNAIDHGIEFPMERGTKSEEGRIVIQNFDHGKNWEIIVRDDGCGIAPERVVAKALSLQIIDAATALSLSDDEKCALIFREGLSTAETVTDISGRGVGLPAVLAAIKDAGGDLKLHSTVGQGTEFRILVPKRNVSGLATAA